MRILKDHSHIEQHWVESSHIPFPTFPPPQDILDGAFVGNNDEVVEET